MTEKGPVPWRMVSSSRSVAGQRLLFGTEERPMGQRGGPDLLVVGRHPYILVVVGCPPSVTVASRLYGTKVRSLTSGSSAMSASTARRERRGLRAHKSAARSALERENEDADAVPERASASRYGQDMSSLQIHPSD